MGYQLRLTMEVVGQEDNGDEYDTLWPSDRGNLTVELSIGDYAEKEDAFGLRETLFYGLRGIVALAKASCREKGAP